MSGPDRVLFAGLVAAWVVVLIGSAVFTAGAISDGQWWPNGHGPGAFLTFASGTTLAAPFEYLARRVWNETRS